MSPETAAALEREALRLFDRYAAEVVEALGLCPWAAAARAAGEVERRVIVDAAPTVAQLADAIDEVAARPGAVIGILILPRLAADPAAHRRLAAAVGAEHRRRGGPGAPMAIADFHPDAPCDLGAPARLVPFLRRTPDPTLQLVRLATLDSIKRAAPSPTLARQAALLAGTTAAPAPPLSDRIAAANAATIAHLGATAITALLDDIRDDRTRTYARLGLP